MTGAAVRPLGMALCLSLVVCPPAAVLAQVANASTTNQDPLARARELYASARFEDALQILESLQGTAATPEARAYQVYCLVALGRRDDARKVIEKIVRSDPFYRPQKGLVAPHIQAFFEDTRRPFLPVLARESYAQAKAAYDKKDMMKAAAGFDRVIALIDEVGGNDPGLGDLRMVSVALRDFAHAALPAANGSAARRTGGEAAPMIYDAQSAGVVAPLPISTPLPDWRPGFFELNRTFSGQVRLIVGEDGTVMSAEIAASVHARYDGRLVEAAKSWTFKPATKDGRPVAYLYLMPVRVLR